MRQYEDKSLLSKLKGVKPGQGARVKWRPAMLLETVVTMDLTVEEVKKVENEEGEGSTRKEKHPMTVELRQKEDDQDIWVGRILGVDQEVPPVYLHRLGRDWQLLFGDKSKEKNVREYWDDIVGAKGALQELEKYSTIAGLPTPMEAQLRIRT